MTYTVRLLIKNLPARISHKHNWAQCIGIPGSENLKFVFHRWNYPYNLQAYNGGAAASAVGFNGSTSFYVYSF